MLVPEQYNNLEEDKREEVRKVLEEQAEDLEALERNPGFQVVLEIWNNLQVQYGSMLEGSDEVKELYRAQGALEALRRLHNERIMYRDKFKEDTYDET